MGVTYTGFREGDTALDVLLPMRHAEDEQAGEDVVEGVRGQLRIRGIHDVALNVADIREFGTHVWSDRKVDSVGLSSGEGMCHLVGDSPSAASDVQHFANIVWR